MLSVGEDCLGQTGHSASCISLTRVDGLKKRVKQVLNFSVHGVSNVSISSRLHVD